MRNRPQRDRREAAKQCLWAVPKKRLSDDAHDVDLLVNSVVTFVAFCDMRRGSVCILPGRCKTLEACQCCRVVFSWQSQHFVQSIVRSHGRRSFL